VEFSGREVGGAEKNFLDAVFRPAPRFSGGALRERGARRGDAKKRLPPERGPVVVMRCVVANIERRA